MLYRSVSLVPHTLFIVLVIELYLISTKVWAVSASSRCSGGRLRPAAGWGSTQRVPLGSGDKDKVIPLVVPECVNFSPLNITYIIDGVPAQDYLIISGNITCFGSLSITDGSVKKIFDGSRTLTNKFTFHSTLGSSVTIINYSTNKSSKGCGPTIELFYSSVTTARAGAALGPVSCQLGNTQRCYDGTNMCFLLSQRCNGHKDCQNGYDEKSCTIIVDSGCADLRRRCSVTADHQFVCLPTEWICNGKEECPTGIDESGCLSITTTLSITTSEPTVNPACCTVGHFVSKCNSAKNCNCGPYISAGKALCAIKGCNGEYGSESISLTSGSLSLPKWPQVIPYNITYEWEPVSTDVNMIITFSRVVTSDGDTVTMYSGDVSQDLARSQPEKPCTLPIKQNQTPRLNIVMLSPASVYIFKYEFTKGIDFPPGAAFCNDVFFRPCSYKGLCYASAQKCDGIMDCTNGKDEVGCGTLKEYGHVCAKDEIMCQNEQSNPKCFTMSQRCDGSDQCSNSYDEKNCDSTLCGTHNGTFLCPEDSTCIYETWLCDKTKDCSDGADELNCEGTSLKVITASVIGSLVCAIMIVIAVGCSCKLHANRQYENMHHRSRYESPMTRITNELMRRAAPPPYAEAMQRSRPFEEVQNEYLAALEQHRNEESPQYAEEEILEEERSVASASGVLDTTDTSLVELTDDTVSYRRNPNKPPENSETRQGEEEPTLVPLDPKSDEEAEADDDLPTSNQSMTEDTRSNSSLSRRQMLRRSSVDSDVSLLSRDSDDAPLIR